MPDASTPVDEKTGEIWTSSAVSTRQIIESLTLGQPIRVTFKMQQVSFDRDIHVRSAISYRGQVFCSSCTITETQIAELEFEDIYVTWAKDGNVHHHMLNVIKCDPSSQDRVQMYNLQLHVHKNTRV